MQAEAEELEKALTEAMMALEKKEPTEAKKDALEQAVKEASKKKKEDYTNESWKAFERVLKQAEAVLKDKKSTQTQVDEERLF